VTRMHGNDEALAADALSGDTPEQRQAALERQIGNLEIAIRSQRSIGTAIGLLAHRFGCPTDEAWQLLVRVSQDTNTKVREIARMVTDAHDGQGRAEDAATLVRLSAELPGKPATSWPICQDRRVGPSGLGSRQNGGAACTSTVPS